MTTLSIQDPDFLRQRFYWFCLWPAFLVLILVTLAPTVYLFIISFTPLDLTRPETNWNFSNPVGQYKIIMEDKRLHNSWWIQIKLSFWTVSIQMILGFLFALLLNIKSKILEALRTIFFDSNGFTTNCCCHYLESSIHTRHKPFSLGS